MENRVADVRDKKEISIEQYKDLSHSGSRPGIMHGSAKVRKIVTDGLPSFRPILSGIDIPRYKLAKFLVPMLEHLATNEYTIKDSFTFAEELQSFDSKLVIATLWWPKSYKYNLLFTLLPRAFKLCSNFELFHQEIDKLKTIFKSNDIPKVLLISVLKST